MGRFFGSNCILPASHTTPIMADHRSVTDIFSAAFGGRLWLIRRKPAENSGYAPHSFPIARAFLSVRTSPAAHAATVSIAVRFVRMKNAPASPCNNEALGRSQLGNCRSPSARPQLFEIPEHLIVIRPGAGAQHLRQRYLLPCCAERVPREALIVTASSLRARTRRQRAPSTDAPTDHDHRSPRRSRSEMVAWPRA